MMNFSERSLLAAFGTPTPWKIATMIKIEKITKTYRLGEVNVPVLNGIDLSIIVTHEPDVPAQTKRIIQMQDGLVVD